VEFGQLGPRDISEEGAIDLGLDTVHRVQDIAHLHKELNGPEETTGDDSLWLKGIIDYVLLPKLF